MLMIISKERKKQRKTDKFQTYVSEREQQYPVHHRRDVTHVVGTIKRGQKSEQVAQATDVQKMVWNIESWLTSMWLRCTDGFWVWG